MRRLWNRPDLAVWSLSTQDADGTPNLNICSYVMATSLDPKLMTVAVYHGTKTRENIKVGSTVLLQLLTAELAPVVRVCGQTSGHDVDKVERLSKRYELAEHKGLYYFMKSAGFMLLEVNDVHENGGDHSLVTGKVVTSKNLSTASILTTTYLKDHKFTR
jgi:flavin reductase (DIM6/NTAB) family NADH-FMN oxidoreductase RutF